MILNNCHKQIYYSEAEESTEVTPQIILHSFHRLHHFQLHIKYSQLFDYIKTHYPVEKDSNKFQQELISKLICAVQVGLIKKCGEDKYGLPTFLNEANANHHAIPLFKKFWNKYYEQVD